MVYVCCSNISPSLWGRANLSEFTEKLTWEGELRSGRSPVVGQAKGSNSARFVKLRCAGFTGFSLMRGFAPHPTKGSASGLCQRVNKPFGNPLWLRRFYRFIAYYRLFSISSSSFIQMCTEASLGIRKSPRGERVTLPTFGPSGRQERLNCCEKNRQ